MLKSFAVLLIALFTLVGCTKKSDAPENSISFPLRFHLKGLDPAKSADEATELVVPNIAEGLLQYHYLKRPFEVEPLLAEGMPTVSKDGLIHTFKLRKGIKFQDSEVFPDGKGREVTAQDFIYSWKRLADPKTQSDGWWIFDGKIKGLNEWREKISKGEATYDTPVEGFETPDAHTLIVKLKVPYYQLNYVLAMTYAAVVPHEAVTKYGEEFINHPVGTGPYIFESWIRGNKVTLKRNPNWHGGTYPTEGEAGDQEKGLLADAGKALPFVDVLMFLELPEDQPRWLNLVKGVLDIGPIPKDNFDGAIADKKLRPELAAKGLQLQIYEDAEVVFIAFNMADPILGKNANLRRALAMAYDTKTAMEKFYNNRVIMAHSMIGPGVDGYDASFQNPYKEYNVEKAKELLKKAGYPDGKGLPTLELSDSGSTTSRQMSEYMVQQFAKIGVKLNIVSNSWPQFQDRIRNKKAQMFGMAWNADYPDAQNFMQLFYGPNVSPGPNSSNFQNKEFDTLYEQSLKMPPGPARTAIYKKMRDIFVDQMPWIPTVHRQGFVLSHGWVKNLKRSEMMRGFFKYLRVDLEKKKELKAKL